MADVIMPLIRDLLDWVAREPRANEDAMDAWRTSCPRLTVWEDAADLGLIERYVELDGRLMVRVTEKGRAMMTTRMRYGT